MPAQLSVHREGRDGRQTHHAWLAEGPSDPRETLARRLIRFTRGAKTILAHNAAFERRCVRELQEHFPHLAEELQEVEERFEDLLPLVRNHVDHPGFNGSFSIKSVAPVLGPETSYEGLEVAGGGEASQHLFRLLLRREGMTRAQFRKLRGELMKYCGMGTGALARLHKAMLSLSVRG